SQQAKTNEDNNRSCDSHPSCPTNRYRMDPLLKLLPCHVFVYGTCQCKLPAVVPDLFELVVIGKVGVIDQPLLHLFLLFEGRLIEQVFYQQVIVNMVKFGVQGITVLIIILITMVKNQPVWFLITSMLCPCGFLLSLLKYPVFQRSLCTSYLRSGSIETQCG